MPHWLSFVGHAQDDAIQQMGPGPPPKRPRAALFRSFGDLLRKPEQQQQQQHAPAEPLAPLAAAATPVEPHAPATRVESRRGHVLEPGDASTTRFSTSLPFPPALSRRESALPDMPLDLESSSSTTETTAVNADRRRSPSRGPSPSPSPTTNAAVPVPALAPSAPEMGAPAHPGQWAPMDQQPSPIDAEEVNRDAFDDRPPPPPPVSDGFDGVADVADADDEREIDYAALQKECDQTWILNLSMHFRDRSRREKFFITFPDTWRRITVSVDYRNAPPGSLEADLSSLRYQGDKSLHIYEAIRESLADIQFYDTVTNLTLETNPEDGQLHVHVREDVNEVVQYPGISLFQHVGVRRYAESELEYQSHFSGFVYLVRADGRDVVKKEIPGPDTIDEFLYEINALDSLRGYTNVVQIEGLVTDDAGSVVKALLISHASKGSLMDMLSDFDGKPGIPWWRREKWAKQIVQGLSNIHEAGFVQGDFTLSNIVIDANDDALIIDINRRGCPVGWEPPELNNLIDSGQRISMCIGVKTDLFQLGMVLWALAEENDEPEREPKPLRPVVDRVPSYFRRMVKTCLSERPQGRHGGVKLLRSFPTSAGRPPSTSRLSVDFVEPAKVSDQSVSTHRSNKEYIDPELAITLDEVRRRHTDSGPTDFTPGQVTYVDPDSNAASTSYHFESSGSWIVGRGRGRSPFSSRRRRSSPYARSISSVTSFLSSEFPVIRLPQGPICGSDCSEAEIEKASEPTVSALHHSGMRVKDRPSSRAPQTSPEVVTRRGDGNSVPAPLAHQSISSIHARDCAQLMHTDSGFNEDMIDELNLAGATVDNTILGEGASHLLSNVIIPAPPSSERLDNPVFYTPTESPMPAGEGPAGISRENDGNVRRQT